MIELVRELIGRVKTADDWLSPRHVEALVVLDEFRDDPCYVADVIGLLLDRIAELDAPVQSQRTELEIREHDDFDRQSDAEREQARANGVVRIFNAQELTTEN